MTTLALRATTADGRIMWWCRQVTPSIAPPNKWVEESELDKQVNRHRPLVFKTTAEANTIMRYMQNQGRDGSTFEVVPYKLTGPSIPYVSYSLTSKGAPVNKTFLAKAAAMLVASGAMSADLTPKQEKIDLNDNGKVDGDDLKRLRESEPAKASPVQSFLARAAATSVRALAMSDVETFLKSNKVSKDLIKKVLDSAENSTGRTFTSALDGADVGSLSGQLTKSLGAPTKDKGSIGTKTTQVWRMGKLGKVILTVDKSGAGKFKFNL